MILSLALSKGIRPICRKSEAHHAVAAAAFGLTAQGMEQVLLDVRDRLNARIGEMIHETVFTTGSLRMHLLEIRRIAALLSGLAGHPAAQCFRLLPGAHAVHDEILKAAAVLEQEIIDKVDLFLLNLPDPVLRAERIRKAIRKHIPRALIVVLGHPAMLQQALGKTRGIAARVRRDWTDDTEAIALDGVCD
jgi:hypothetical protein